MVKAERAGKNPRKVIEEITAEVGDTEAAVSVITVVELAHGIERADTVQRKLDRERFLQELLEAIPAEPVTTQIALRAGKLDAGLQAKGTRVALDDLLIGATALELGYSVLTYNARHFRMIPGVIVRQVQ